jgi:hypothetical protein
MQAQPALWWFAADTNLSFVHMRSQLGIAAGQYNVLSQQSLLEEVQGS